MKKTTLLMISVLLLAAIFISACSAAGAAGSDDTENVAIAAGESDASADIGEAEKAETPSDDSLAVEAEGVRQRLAEGELSLSTKLTLGTFKLEDTAYPIDVDQAAELLPLWKALRSLSESETVASEEIEAVLNQIQDTMTVEQIAAIEDMQLTNGDMGAIFEELGLEFVGGGGFGNLTPEMQATMQAARESGEFPGSGRGLGQGAGGGFPGGGEFDPDARATAIAERGGARGANLGVNPVLLEAVIEFIEGKL